MQELSVYEEACRVQFRYAQGVDRRDWDLYRSVMTDQVLIDFRSFGYGSVMTMSAQDWVRQVRKVMDGLDASQHLISNCVLHPDGDRLRLQAYVMAQHVLRTPGEPDRMYLVGGTYDNLLERTEDGLRLAEITFGQLWVDGDPTVMTDAVARARQ